MNHFQLDECANDKRLADQCNKAGKCAVRRWPREYRGKKDHVWFPALLSSDAPIVTIDFTIALDEENRRALPSSVSGIIVVRPERPIPNFGAREAAAIIESFKGAFPAWHATDWSNVYLEIDGAKAYVCDFTDRDLVNGEQIQFDAPDFVERLQLAIAKAKGAGDPLAIQQN